MVYMGHVFCILGSAAWVHVFKGINLRDQSCTSWECGFEFGVRMEGHVQDGRSHVGF